LLDIRVYWNTIRSSPYSPHWQDKG